MSAARLAIGPNICVARTSGVAFRPLGVRPSRTRSHGSDIAIVAADGLSAIAIGFNLLPVLDCLRPLLALGV